MRHGNEINHWTWKCKILGHWNEVNHRTWEWGKSWDMGMK